MIVQLVSFVGGRQQALRTGSVGEGTKKVTLKLNLEGQRRWEGHRKAMGKKQF